MTGTSPPIYHQENFPNTAGLPCAAKKRGLLKPKLAVKKAGNWPERRQNFYVKNIAPGEFLKNIQTDGIDL